MSTYVAGRATNLGIGEQLTLAGVVSLGDAPFTTPTVAVGRSGVAGSDSSTVFNASNAVATVQVSASDTDAGFLPLTDADTAEAITIAAGSAATFRCIGPFARLSFPTDPAGSGAVVFSR